MFSKGESQEGSQAGACQQPEEQQAIYPTSKEKEKVMEFLSQRFTKQLHKSYKEKLFLSCLLI